MEKEINFTGLNLTPYSDISPDGQLSLAEGIERHAASIRPVTLQGKTIFEDILTSYDTLLYLHSTASYNRFIILREMPHEGPTVHFIEESEGTLHQFYYLREGETIHKVTSVGNTLILLLNTGLHYFLYNEGQYKDLGTHIPFPKIQFGLQAQYRMKYSSVHNKTYNSVRPGVFDWENITAEVMPKIEAAIARVNKDGMFIFPFLVRYAVRLYDGRSFVNHSAPVLMIPSNGQPFIAVRDEEEYNDAHMLTSFRLWVRTIVSSLVYQVIDTNGIESDWEDIIESIDIFISHPFDGIDREGECSIQDLDYNDFLVAKWNGGDGSSRAEYSQLSKYYQKWKLVDFFAMTYHSGLLPGGNWPVNLAYIPRKDKQLLAENIKQCGSFYLAKSIKPSELAKQDALEEKIISFEEDYLTNITLKEAMSDDYLTHDTKIADICYTYNSRLNLANIQRKLFEGFDPAILCCKADGYLDYTPGYWTSGTTYEPEQFPDTNDSTPIKTLTSINENNKTIIVQSQSSRNIARIGFGYYLFYPNNFAYRMNIEFGTTNQAGSVAGLRNNLQQHMFINGGVFFEGFSMPEEVGYIIASQPTENQVVAEPNKIYTSEVNNPFYFPLNGINTIGTGSILGLSSITTPLSQGQFGQFTLMAFCTDGNYALQVNDEGLYAGTPPPMQRDVCTNPDSITQIAGEVIFVSARGAMSADGSIIKCISDALNGVPEDTGKLLPTELFQQCRVAYDYAGRRLIFFSTTNDESYILSLEDGTWSQGNFGQIKTVLNIYPYSYIQLAVPGSIIQLNTPYQYNADTGLHAGHLITRPMKLDSLQLKRLHQFKLEGIFNEPQQIKIYGSQNGIDWQLIGETNRRRVGHMPGRYYKYYRFEIVTNLRETENISGIRLEYDIRPESRMR